MIIAGAGGHAREILSQLDRNALEVLYFFDNVSDFVPEQISGISVIRTETAVKEILKTDARFIIGTGKPAGRKNLYELFCQWGGECFSFVAATAFVSEQQTTIGEGVNIMHEAFISCDVKLGKGCLVNTRAHLHHDVSIGDFCEIGPAALLLGGVKIGHDVRIGAGAILLPGIEIGNEVRVGAGAVVTKNIHEGKTVKGNPAV